MTKEELVDLVRKILNTEADLDFLSDLEQRDLETLIACIRDRIEQEKRKANSSKINEISLVSGFLVQGNKANESRK